MRSASLLLRTSLTLGISALAIALVSIVALNSYVIEPIARQSASDEAALLVLSAQTWVELPPEARPFFELELVESHGLVVSPEVRELGPRRTVRPYVELLEGSLTERLGQAMVLAEDDELLWAEIPMGGYLLQIGFSPDRRDIEPLSVALIIFVVGAGIVLLTSLLIVQRITRPLDAIAESARAFRGGEYVDPIPETGPSELVMLARSFNVMARDIAEMISNRTTLLAGISHDLRTPLARMRLAVELLPEETDPALIERLQRNLQQMDDLLSITLQFARGLSRENVRHLTLKPWLQQVLEDHGDPTIELQWDASDQLQADVDPGALERVISNLLNNAELYGGGAVTVRVKGKASGGLNLHVMDRGPGIPEAQRDHIFQPFYRLERSRNQDTGGSGLGLAIVRQLCDAQGWGIDVRDRPGGGADFRIRIREGGTR